MWKSVSWMADSESAQTYGPPEWMEQHVINQALVLKDIVLALTSELEDRKTRRGGKNAVFSHLSSVSCGLEFWQLCLFSFLFELFSDSFTCFPLSVFTDLPLLFPHNCVWTRGSFSTVLAATRGWRKRDGGRASSGEAWQMCYFPSASHWLCQQWFNLLKKESVQAQSSLTTYPFRLSEETYQSYSSRRKLAVALLPHPPTAPFLLDFYPVVLASLRFPHFFPSYFTGLVYKSFWTEPQLFTGLKLKPLW